MARVFRYPCQHERYLRLADSSWINNTTYCNGQDSVCTSDTIVTIPKLSLSSPGVVRHDYPFTEAPIVPQVRLTRTDVHSDHLIQSGYISGIFCLLVLRLTMYR